MEMDIGSHLPILRFVPSHDHPTTISQEWNIENDADI